MIQYRPFRNPDPPELVEVWNQSFGDRSAVPLPCCTPFEEHVLAKLTFDFGGLIVAEEDGQIVGFAHAGFGPNDRGSGVTPEAGVLAMVVVKPGHRRRGIGSELVRRCQGYLRAAGAKSITAGSVGGNPFYMGLYGGSDGTGFLASDAAAGPFLAFHGFAIEATSVAMQRRLTGKLGFGDGRFADFRRRYDFRAAARKGVRGWWHEIVLGPLELYDFFIEEKGTGAVVARAAVWEMSGFSQRWNELAAGLVEVEVRSEDRRKGLGRFVLSETFRYLQDQYFTVVEVQSPRDDAVLQGLFHGVGFQVVDQSHVYRLS